ncbi:MAG: hypothetical protein H0T76_29225 [Nannocystis sp.]|nr:hypothetical protein [Nannocystis sp.]MBA3550577.1 hypothetical protein [Nannocystis sp.]
MRPAIFPCVVALLLALTACAEPDEHLAPLGELCGAVGPVRVLELGPEQAVIYRPRRIGERLFYDIGRPAPGTASHPFVAVTDEQLWTTGLCGEAPMRLDAQYRTIFAIDRWPGLALATDHADNIVSLSATGPLAPHIVFAGIGGGPIWWSARGAISMDGERNLHLHRYPDDPRSETAVSVLLPADVQSGSELFRIAVAGEDLLVLRPTQELVSIDLADGAVTLEQPDVGAFVASPSGRYFLWTPGDATTLSPMILHDRETGQGVYLGDTKLILNWNALEFAEQGLVVVRLTMGEQRIYHLPSLEFVVVPPGYTLDTTSAYYAGPRADGRWTISAYEDSSLHTIDPNTGTVTTMFPRPGQVLAHELGGTLVLAVGQCCGYARADDEGSVWFIPRDGSEPTRIAARSTLFGWRARADSLITLVDIGGDRRARLVQVDTHTQTERLIDDHVFAAYLEDPTDPDIIRYSVQDGERSGVWQVRLPP